MQNVFRVVLLAALACVALCRTLETPRREFGPHGAQNTHYAHEHLLEVQSRTVLGAGRRLAEVEAPTSTAAANTTALAPDTVDSNATALAPVAAPPPADVRPEDVTFTVVKNCKTVIESLEANYPEFASLITDVLPNVTPETVTDTFSDPEATITVLMPPADSARGLRYAYDQGDITDEEVRDVVLVHILAEKLTFQDLVELPEETQVDTLLDGAAIKPSLAGATSGSNAGQAGSGSIALVDVDLDVCTDSSTMHTVRALLVPDDVDLPESAGPRGPNEQGEDVDAETAEEVVTTKDLPVDGTSGNDGDILAPGAVIGIAVGGGLVLMAIVTALCCCFNERCSSACCGSTRADKVSSKGKAKDDFSSGMESTIGAKPLHLQSPVPPGSLHYSSDASGNPTRPGSYALATPGSHPSIHESSYGSTPGSHVNMHHMHAMGAGGDASGSYSQRFTAGSSAAGTGGSIFGVVPSGTAPSGPPSNHSGQPSTMRSSWTNMPNASAPGTAGQPARQSTQSSWRSMHGLGSDAYPYPTGPGGLTTMGTTDVPSSQLTPPDENSSPDDIKAWVEEQLDLLADTPLLDRFVSLGPNERRRGGQAVVQFACSKTDPNQYALKFFLSSHDFEAEKKIYTDSPLGSLLPRHEGLFDNTDSILMDSKGHKLPPCIVMERGESLDEWSRRRKPDMWAAMPVLANIAKRLEAMHDAGYAHRDLKPANVMWLPRENQWTLIDFGCAAKLHEQAPLSFTLGYAAPETIRAWQTGQKSILSQAATDAWSLGVMVFELLTGKPAFDVFLLGRHSVVRQLLGEAPLPWERMTVATRKTLGAFKGPIMQLLNRDPSQRPSMSQFYDNCNAIFSTSTTYTPAAKGSMGSSSANNTSDLMHVESGATSSANNTEGVATSGNNNPTSNTSGEQTQGGANAANGGVPELSSGFATPSGTTPSGSTRSGSPGPAPAGLVPGVLTEGATINGSTEMPKMATETIRE